MLIRLLRHWLDVRLCRLCGHTSPGPTATDHCPRCNARL